MSVNLEVLENKAKELGIDLNKRQLCQFFDYFNLLVEWNEKINLTAITEWEEVVVKHFIDSLSIVKCFGDFSLLVDSTKDKSLVDVGTGAGFPGIVLKILLPELKVTLMDSLEKRVKFLNIVCDKLELKDICAVHGRVEDLAQMDLYREKFDFATARAVASLPVLSEYCLPFVKVGGIFYAYKSEKASEEIDLSKNGISLLGGEIIDYYNFVLPDTELKRTIIEIGKKKNTDRKYPRKAGVPSKKPL